MFGKSTIRKLVLIFFSASLNMLPQKIMGSQENIDKAIEVIKTGCIAQESVSIEMMADGSLSVMKKGGEIKISFSKEEMPSLLRSLQENYRVDQADKMRDCMAPHIPKILEATLKSIDQPQKAAQQKLSILKQELDEKEELYCSEELDGYEIFQDSKQNIVTIEEEAARRQFDMSALEAVETLGGSREFSKLQKKFFQIEIDFRTTLYLIQNELDKRKKLLP
jgi:hypothetical protein